MKFNSKKIILLLIAFLTVEMIIAQPPPPPPPPGLDISGGVFYLVLAGIILGINKLRK